MLTKRTKTIIFIIILISLPALAVNAEGQPRGGCPLCIVLIFGKPCLEGREEATKFCEYEKIT